MPGPGPERDQPDSVSNPAACTVLSRSLGSLRFLQSLPWAAPGPHLHTGLPLCRNTPAPVLAIRSVQCLPRLQRRPFHSYLNGGWVREDVVASLQVGVQGQVLCKGARRQVWTTVPPDLGFRTTSIGSYLGPPFTTRPLNFPSPPSLILLLRPPCLFCPGSGAPGLCLCKQPPPL